MWGVGGEGGREPGRIGAGEVREAGEIRAGSGSSKMAGSGSSKMAGCGSEMKNATHCHLVCIIPKEQEREMIFDSHQRLLSNQANKNSHLV